jgi:Rrf2 family protein
VAAVKISTKGRYALRIMLDLAKNESGGFIPLKDISARQGITVKYMEQIISALCKAGLVKSSRGSSGGYRLAKKPGEYKIGDILRVMEGGVAVVACLEDAANACPRSAACATLPFWRGLNRAIEEYMDSVTLEGLLEESPTSP